MNMKQKLKHGIVSSSVKNLAEYGVERICFSLTSYYSVNPLTAVSIYICPDHFSCAKKIVKNHGSLKNSEKYIKL